MKNNALTRRHLLQSGLALGEGLTANLTPDSALANEPNTTQTEPNGFFTFGQRSNHW